LANKLSPIKKISLHSKQQHIMNFGFNLGGMNIGMGMNMPNMGITVSHNMAQQPLRVGDKLFLKSLTTNKYLCAEQNQLVANRDAPGPWETFTVEASGKGLGQEIRYGDKIGLRGHWGKLVCAEPQSVVCNRDGLGPWEQFTIVDPANTYNNNIIPQWGALAALRSDHGKFVTFEYDGRVTAFRDQPQQTEQFHVTVAGLPGSIDQYQKAPQVSMNTGFGVVTNQQQSYPSYPQQPQYSQPQFSQPQYHQPQPVVIQTTNFVQSQLCKKCNGKGAFNPWGPCELDDFHKKYNCSVCNGQKTTTRQRMCQACSGKGGKFKYLLDN
jgi:hypothetical protein